MTEWKCTAAKTFQDGILYKQGSVITRPDDWLPPMKDDDKETAKWEPVKGAWPKKKPGPKPKQPELGGDK